MEKLMIGALAIGLVTLIAVPSAFYNYATQDTIVATVTEKDRVTQGAGESMSSRYLIFTDEGVLQNTDTIFHMKFNSSDVYGSISVGDTCIFETYGWRVPLFSMYPNIISAECVSEES